MVLVRRVIILGLMAPFVWLFIALLTDSIGISPVDTLTRTTGHWAVRLLILTLALSLFRNIPRLRGLNTLTKPVGLLSLFYATLHVLTFVGYDHFFNARTIYSDLVYSRHIVFGLISFIILILLGITSTKKWMRRLGRKWKYLHRLIYPATAAVVVHYLVQAKLSSLDFTLYTVAFAMLLLYRFVRFLIARHSNSARNLINL